MTGTEEKPIELPETWFRSEDHPAWFQHFSEEQQQEMLADDLVAGRSVPYLLTAVICAGVVLAVTSVLLMW